MGRERGGPGGWGKGGGGWVWNSAVSSLLTPTHGRASSSVSGVPDPLVSSIIHEEREDEGEDKSCLEMHARGVALSNCRDITPAHRPSLEVGRVESISCVAHGLDTEDNAVSPFRNSRGSDKAQFACHDDMQKFDNDGDNDDCPQTFEGVVEGLEMEIATFLDLEDSNFAFRSSGSDIERGGVMQSDMESIRNCSSVMGESNCSVIYEDSTTASTFVLPMPLYNLKREVLDSSDGDESVEDQELFESVCYA